MSRYHAVQEQGLLFVTMRYVDGIELGRLLARAEPGRAAAVVVQVAVALDAAHALGRCTAI